MKKHYGKIIFVVLAVLIVGGLYYYNSKQSVPVVDDESTVIYENDVRGCYVAKLAKDVYTVKLSLQNEEQIQGTLSFKNFEKDSSSGTFKGTYKDGILLGDYSFQSEGMDSVMQVIFKKVDGGFVRGYGDVTAEGTRFVDTKKITYDTKVVFKTVADCPIE